MKHLASVLCIALLAALAVPAMAQGDAPFAPPPPPQPADPPQAEEPQTPPEDAPAAPTAEERLEALAQALEAAEVDDETAAAILEAFAAMLLAGEDRTAQRTAMMALMTLLREAGLTEEQFRAIIPVIMGGQGFGMRPRPQRPEGDDEGEERPAPPTNEERLARLAELLGETDLDEETIAGLLEAYGALLESEGTRQERMAAMRAFMEALQQAGLTEEQVRAMMRELMGGGRRGFGMRPGRERPDGEQRPEGDRPTPPNAPEQPTPPTSPESEDF